MKDFDDIAIGEYILSEGKLYLTIKFEGSFLHVLCLENWKPYFFMKEYCGKTKFDVYTAAEIISQYPEYMI